MEFEDIYVTVGANDIEKTFTIELRKFLAGSEEAIKYRALFYDMVEVAKTKHYKVIDKNRLPGDNVFMNFQDSDNLEETSHSR